jgi:mono/diheme cytochrome c family protein
MVIATLGVGSKVFQVTLRVALGALALTATPAWAAGQGQAARQEAVTFTKDIAPILQRSCQACHRPPPGGGAPMSLLTYEDVRPWARAIKQRTSRREMPPWFIEKNVGVQAFKDDPSLSDQEIATIGRWVDSGAPRGSAADMPPPKTFSDGIEWTIGKPDLIVSSPEKTVEAVAADWHGYWQSTLVGLNEDRYIQAVEVHEVRVQQARTGASRTSGLGGYSVIHHAGITAGTPTDSGEPGPVGFMGNEGFGMTHEAGQNATVYPDGLGVQLQAGSSLAWRVHTHSFGEEVVVRIDVGFKFHPKGYTPKYNLRAGAIGGLLANNDLDIPAGEDNIRFDAVSYLRTPAKLVTFEPHMHAGGKRMCLNATFPNGIRQTLTCAGYNHNWVKVYNYADDAAPILPAGTVIHVMAWYDNSTKNRNIVEPRNWHGLGSRSIDDMFFFLGRWVPLTEEQYKEEMAARQQRRPKATTQNNND